MPQKLVIEFSYTQLNKIQPQSPKKHNSASNNSRVNGKLRQFSETYQYV